MQRGDFLSFSKHNATKHYAIPHRAPNLLNVHDHEMLWNWHSTWVGHPCEHTKSAMLWWMPFLNSNHTFHGFCLCLTQAFHLFLPILHQGVGSANGRILTIGSTSACSTQSWMKSNITTRSHSKKPIHRASAISLSWTLRRLISRETWWNLKSTSSCELISMCLQVILPASQESHLKNRFAK